MALHQDFRVEKGIVVNGSATVAGSTGLTGPLTVSNTVSVGNSTITGTLSVSSSATLGSAVINGAVESSGKVNAASFSIGATLVANTQGISAVSGAFVANGAGIAARDQSTSTVVATQPTIAVSGTEQLAGTVATSGTAVTGTGTFFIDKFRAGDTFRVSGDETIYTVASIAGQTSLLATTTLSSGTGRTIQRLSNTTLGGVSSQLQGALTVVGSSTFNRNVDVSGNTSVAGNTSTNNLSVSYNATVSGALAVTGASTFGNNVSVSGNLVVTGTHAYINTQSFAVASNTVVLNGDWPAGSSPTETVGLVVARGSSANTGLRWNETSDVWEASNGSGTFSQIHYGGTGASSVSSTNSGGTVLQGISATIDTFGHVTGLSVATANLDVRYQSFNTLAVSGQTSIVADAYNDTLTVAKGNGITLATDAASDTLTIGHATAGATATTVAGTGAGGTVVQSISVGYDQFGHISTASVATANLDVRYDNRYLGFSSILPFTKIGTLTASTTSGSNTVVVSSTAGLAANQVVVGSAFPPGTIIVSVTNATTFEVTQAATATLASSQLIYGTQKSLAVADRYDDTLYLGFSDTFTLTSNASVDAIVVEISNANTSVAGIVQLNDTVTSTSTTQAATANAVKTAYDAAQVSASAAATAYSNAISVALGYADTAYSNAVSTAQGLAATAYTNAISTALGYAGSAYANAVAIATSSSSTAYANAINVAQGYAGSAFANAVAFATSSSSTAYANAAVFANTVANNAYANAVTYADTYKAPKANPILSGAISVSAGYIAMSNTAGLKFVTSDVANTTLFTFNSSGNFVAAGSLGAYSDARLKTDVEQIGNAVELVTKLRGVTYIKDGKPGIGVIAQETEKVLPQVVIDNPDGYKSVAYGNIVGVLIEAIKQLNEKIEDLQDQIDLLKGSQ